VMNRRQRTLIILILGSLTALGPFSIDMYLPGFISIARDLDTTTARVGLSLSSYFIGISVGQLLYGPLLDRFGRKKPLYVGLILYIVSSTGCMVANTIDMLIALRFFQAIGSCAAAVAAMAMVRDIFPVGENAKIFSLLILILGTSPLVAPTVGGYLIEGFGWHSVFLVLLIMGAAILAAVFFLLPESGKPDPSFSLKPAPIIRNFISVIRIPQFYTYALTGAVAFAGLFAYVSGSPVVFMEVFQVDGKTYGWIFALLSVGFVGGSQVNTLLLKRFTSEQIIRVVLSAQASIGLLFLILSLNGWIGLYGTIVLLFLFLSCLGLANPNAAALTLEPFSKNAGSASAVMGALQMGVGTLASVGVSMFEVPSIVPMVGVIAASAVIALVILLVGRAAIEKHKVRD